jgi:hypothetical protein
VTNLTRILTSWTAVATNSFDSGGHVLLTNTIGSAPQEFFILKMP